MNTGRTLQQLATELERQTTTKRDYLASQGAITAKVIGTQFDGDRTAAEQPRQELVLDGFNGAALGITSYAHGQIADHLGIPKKYYDRMKADQPDLLAKNVNTWLHEDGGAKRMVRTMDGQVRGFLSPKYRPLDNFDLAQAVLPKLIDLKAQIVSSELTETRMYVKAILPTLSSELPEGLKWGQGHNLVGANHQDGRIVAAIVISNSEIGNGTLRVEPSVFTTWCTNLAVMAQAAMKKYHVGRAFEADTNLEIFRDETRKQDDLAFWMKVADVTAAAFDPAIWEAAVATMRAAGTVQIISQDLPKVAEVTVKQLALPERTTTGLLASLARGGDLTKLGLSQTITWLANTEKDYETATLLERAGGEVLTLEGRNWDVISRAGAAA